MEEEDILQTDFIINPTQGRGLSGVATSAEPLLQKGSQLGDIQEVEPGVFLDRTSVTSVNDLFNYYFGGMPSQQPVAETPAETTPQGPILDTPTESQETGDIVDQPLVESGEFGGQPTFTTTPGTTVDPITGDITNPDGTSGGNIVDEFTNTIGTFGGSDVITATPQPGTQVDSETGDITGQDGTYLGNIVDEFGVAGDVYSGAQGPTGIGTGNVLDEFGVAGDVYAQPVFDYEFEATTPEQREEALTQEQIEDTGIVDKAINAIRGVSRQDVINAVQTGRIGLAALTGGSSEVINEIAKQIGGFLVTDAAANIAGDKILQATGAITPTSTAEDIQLNLQQQQAALDPDQDIFDEVALTGGEEDNVNVGTNQQTPAEQIYEADVEAGLATESIFDEPEPEPEPEPAPAPSPPAYDFDDGGSDNGGGGGGGSSTAGDDPGYSGPSPFKKGGFVNAKR